MSVNRRASASGVVDTVLFRQSDLQAVQIAKWGMKPDTEFAVNLCLAVAHARAPGLEAQPQALTAAAPGLLQAARLRTGGNWQAGPADMLSASLRDVGRLLCRPHAPAEYYVRRLLQQHTIPEATDVTQDMLGMPNASCRGSNGQQLTMMQMPAAADHFPHLSDQQPRRFRQLHRGADDVGEAAELRQPS